MIKIEPVGESFEVLVYHHQTDCYVPASYNGAKIFDLQTAELFAGKLTEIHDSRAKFQ